MKQNMKFFTIVISLLIISAIVLTGCMYAIASDNGEMKAYAPGGQTNDGSGGNIVVEDAPLAQTELQEKFNAYLHKDGDAVTVFSEEQYLQLKAIRENGERTPLTYEEVLFIVNDSINMYFTYDEIRLTNSNRDNVVPVSTNQSGNARIIRPNYKSSSEYEYYDAAQQAYERMLVEIYEIIYYRIYMHDAGFETVHHMYHMNKDNIFGDRYMGDLGMISSAVPVGRYQMLAIDGATFSGIENEEKLVGEYKTLLEWEKMYKMDAVIDYPHYPYLNSAVLCTSILNTLRQPMERKFYIAGPKDDWHYQIYPTAELEAMMPHQNFYYEVNAADSEMQPGFSLNYANQTVAMSAARYFSFAMLGKFELQDDVLKMSFGDNEKTYSYVFYKYEKGYVYSAENSKPATGGFDFVDGLVFEEVYIGVSTNPGDNPPDNTEEDNIEESDTSNDNNNGDNKNEIEMPYFKLDFDGTICSLMSPDGYGYADGTYIREGDALVLYFETDFQYTFYYNEDVGYVYCKGESNPVPGYEIADETVFSLVDDYVLLVDTDEN